MHAGTGIALADRADDFQVAVLKPSAKVIRYSLASRLTRTSTRVESAFTTEMPTPCKPPENW